MGIGRWAGDVLAGLQDNAITRSARETAGALVTPIERRLVSDEDLPVRLMNQIANMTPAEGGMSSAQVEALGALGGRAPSQEYLDSVNQALARASGAEGRGAVMRDRVAGVIDRFSPIREQMLAASKGMPAPYNSLTPGGELVADVIGSAPVAYAAIAGGGALAVKGALDVVARMQAGQPVSEEEVAAADAVLKQQLPAAAVY